MDNQILTAVNLQIYLDQNNISAEILHLPAPTPTVEAAAAVLAVHPDQIIKSVLFLADKKPVLVLACGLTRVDRKGLADDLGVSRRRMKIASAEQVLAHTGYAAGSVPPFGHKQPMPTIIDTAVTRLPYEFIYGGGGDVNALLKLTVAELLRVVGE